MDECTLRKIPRRSSAEPYGSPLPPTLPRMFSQLPSLTVEHPKGQIDARLVCVQVLAGSEPYEHLIGFSAKQYDIPEDSVRSEHDGHSTILAFLREGELVGTLSLTCDSHGPIEARSAYPDEIFIKFEGRIATFYRLAVRTGESRMALTAMRTAIAYAMEHGMRLALIGAKPHMLRWYRRLGYEPISDEIYIHPRLLSEHISLYFPADPDLKSPFADIFARVEDPLRAESVRKALHNQLGE